MFYSSNLRQQLIAPRYALEVNNEQDILDQGYEKIYTWKADKRIPMYFDHVKEMFPKHYELVGSTEHALMNGIVPLFSLKRDIK